MYKYICTHCTTPTKPSTCPGFQNSPRFVWENLLSGPSIGFPSPHTPLLLLCIHVCIYLYVHVYIYTVYGHGVYICICVYSYICIHTYRYILLNLCWCYFFCCQLLVVGNPNPSKPYRASNWLWPQKALWDSHGFYLFFPHTQRCSQIQVIWG